MVIETELKARLADPQRIKSALSALGNSRYSYIKKDSYWTYSVERMAMSADSGKPQIRLRIRNEEKKYTDGFSSHTIMVTLKTRKLRDGIETNKEHEITISDSDIFEEILVLLGLTPEFNKEKQGWAWIFDSENQGAPLLAELSQVKNLGWFIELEIISDTRDEQILEENRGRLLAMLDKLGIDRAAIESRPYSELLKPASD